MSRSAVNLSMRTLVSIPKNTEEKLPLTQPAGTSSVTLGTCCSFRKTGARAVLGKPRLNTKAIAKSCRRSTARKAAQRPTKSTVGNSSVLALHSPPFLRPLRSFSSHHSRPVTGKILVTERSLTSVSHRCNQLVSSLEPKWLRSAEPKGFN